MADSSSGRLMTPLRKLKKEGYVLSTHAAFFVYGTFHSTALEKILRVCLVQSIHPQKRPAALSLTTYLPSQFISWLCFGRKGSIRHV